MRRRRLLTALALLLVLPLAGRAQQPKPPHFIDWSDGLLVGSLVADEVTSDYSLKRGNIEVGVLRNRAARVSAKGAWVALFKIWDYYHPEQRRYTRWLKVGFAVGFAALAYHNAGVGRR